MVASVVLDAFNSKEIVMGFATGLVQAMGFRFGMALSQQNELRPVLRKRRLANIAYMTLMVYCICASFSFRSVQTSEHLLTTFLVWAGKPYLYFLVKPWVATMCAAWFAGFLTVVAMISREDSADLGAGWGFVVAVSYVCFYYIFTYDVMYYAISNRCIFGRSIFCVNFANEAGRFATSATTVYVMRSLLVLLPEERAALVYNSSEVRGLRGPGVYLPPTLPMPHVVWVAVVYAYEMIPFLWDIYVHPDGREQSRQQHIR